VETHTASAVFPKRGRPRSERSRRAILDATAALLTERGLRAMTLEAVAERAGVSKTTIYRWWPSKGVLALDAVYAAWVQAQGPTPDTGRLDTDLQARLRRFVRLMSAQQFGRILADLLAEVQSDLEMADAYHEHLQEPLRAQSRTILTRAVDRGELAARTDIEAALDLLYGPLFHRLLTKQGALDRRFADTIVELTLSGLQPGRAPVA
jgi:AcrR family transcriptional regulator